MFRLSCVIIFFLTISCCAMENEDPTKKYSLDATTMQAMQSDCPVLYGFVNDSNITDPNNISAITGWCTIYQEARAKNRNDAIEKLNKELESSTLYTLVNDTNTQRIIKSLENAILHNKPLEIKSKNENLSNYMDNFIQSNLAFNDCLKKPRQHLIGLMHHLCYDNESPAYNEEHKKLIEKWTTLNTKSMNGEDVTKEAKDLQKKIKNYLPKTVKQKTNSNSNPWTNNDDFKKNLVHTPKDVLEFRQKEEAAARQKTLKIVASAACGGLLGGGAAVLGLGYFKVEDAKTLWCSFGGGFVLGAGLGYQLARGQWPKGEAMNVRTPTDSFNSEADLSYAAHAYDDKE